MITQAIKYPFLRWWQSKLIISLLLLALLSPLLSSDLPLFARMEGQNLFPGLRMLWDNHHVERVEGEKGTIEIDYTRIDWRILELQAVVWPLIPYSAKSMDAFNRGYKSPRDQQFIEKDGKKADLSPRLRHYLGTDSVGRDIAAGMLSGLRISIGIGLLSILFAALIALILGSLAGYFGNHFLSYHPMALTATLLVTLLPIYVLVVALPQLWFTHQPAMSALCSMLMLALVIYGSAHGYRFLVKKMPLIVKHQFPVDGLISRFTEIFDSMPKFLLILTLAAVIGRSIFWVALVIGLNGWASISRLLRAEVLKNRNLEYTQAAISSGMRHRRVLLRHVLPNAIGPFLVSVSFGIGSAIIFESNLSFLGLGLPVDTVSWGSMIYQGKNNLHAWWMLAFPTLAIFMTIYTFNSLAERIRARK